MDAPYKTHFLLLGPEVESRALALIEGFRREIDGTLVAHVLTSSATVATLCVRARVGSELSRRLHG